MKVRSKFNERCICTADRGGNLERDFYCQYHGGHGPSLAINRYRTQPPRRYNMTAYEYALAKLQRRYKAAKIGQAGIFDGESKRSVGLHVPEEVA